MMIKGVYKQTEEHKRKISESHKGNKYAWRGDDVGKRGLHRWVERELGKPSSCEHCKTTEDRMYHWSNKSQEYKREVSDWQRLCVPCHRKYDKKGSTV